MKNVVMSVLRDRDSARLGQVAVLHDRADAPAHRAGLQRRGEREHAHGGEDQDEDAGLGHAPHPGSRSPPESHSGANTLTAGAPKRSRAICCRINPTPNVTSSVSSGRSYIRWIRVISSSGAHRAADEEPDRRSEMSSDDTGIGHICLHHVSGVAAGHDELAVRHVDDAHLTEGQRQAQRGQQQDRAEAQSRCQLSDQDIHTVATQLERPGCPRVALQVRVGLDGSGRTPRSCRSGRPAGSRRCVRSW